MPFFFIYIIGIKPVLLGETIFQCRKLIIFIKGVTLYFNKLESPSPKDAFFLSLIEID